MPSGSVLSGTRRSLSARRLKDRRRTVPFRPASPGQGAPAGMPRGGLVVIVVRLRGTIDGHTERDGRAILAYVSTPFVLVAIMHHELHPIDMAHLHDAGRDQVGDVPPGLEGVTFLEGLRASDRGVLPAKTQRWKVASRTEPGIDQGIILCPIRIWRHGDACRIGS